MDELEKIRVLARTQEVNLKKLAELLGEDPKRFYVGTDLSGVDVTGQDLRGMDFSSTNLPSAQWDLGSRFDDEIERALAAVQKKKYLEVSEELLEFTESFFTIDKHFSRGWFIKKITPSAARAIFHDVDFWHKVIADSPELERFFNAQERRRIELTFSRQDYEAGEKLGRRFGGHGAGLTALVIVGLLKLIDFPTTTFIKRPVQLAEILEVYRRDKRFSSRHFTPSMQDRTQIARKSDPRRGGRRKK